LLLFSYAHIMYESQCTMNIRVFACVLEGWLASCYPSWFRSINWFGRFGLTFFGSGQIATRQVTSDHMKWYRVSAFICGYIADILHRRPRDLVSTGILGMTILGSDVLQNLSSDSIVPLNVNFMSLVSLFLFPNYCIQKGLYDLVRVCLFVGWLVGWFVGLFVRLFCFVPPVLKNHILSSQKVHYIRWHFSKFTNFRQKLRQKHTKATRVSWVVLFPVRYTWTCSLSIDVNGLYGWTLLSLWTD